LPYVQAALEILRVAIPVAIDETIKSFEGTKPCLATSLSTQVCRIRELKANCQ